MRFVVGSKAVCHATVVFGYSKCILRIPIVLHFGHLRIKISVDVLVFGGLRIFGVKSTVRTSAGVLQFAHAKLKWSALSHVGMKFDCLFQSNGAFTRR